MRARTQLLILVAILVCTGVGLALYKCYALGFTFLPEMTSTVWQVQGRIQFVAEGGPVKISMILPAHDEYRKTVRSEKIADGYKYVLTEDGNIHKAVWTRDEADGPQVIYYRGDFYYTDMSKMMTPPTEKMPQDVLHGPLRVAAEDLLKTARERSTTKRGLVLKVLELLEDQENNPAARVLRENLRFRRQTMEMAQKILAIEGIHASVERGLRLRGHYTQRSITTFIKVYLDGTWVLLDPNVMEEIPFDQVLLWPQGTRSLLDVYGGMNSRIDVSVSSIQENTGRLAVNAGLLSESKLIDFSIYSLPIKDQNTFRLLLLIPFGALVVVILRNLVGIRTSGTFMPILIALTFMQTTLLLGLLLFLLVVSVGLIMRSYLSHLNLLLVPRIAAVLVFVIIIFATVGILSHKLGWESGLAITFFPMIILSWTIERMSVLWEEAGPREVLIQGGGSLLTASLAYLLMINPQVAHCAFNFPELLLVLLAIIIMIGNYSGFRLVELGRFEPMTRDEK